MFGCVCENCWQTYETEQWAAPWLCRPCAYNRIQTERYLSWLRFRDAA